MTYDLNNSIFDLIKASLWEAGTFTATQTDYVDMKRHAIVALPAKILAPSPDLPDELYQKWKKDILQQLAHSCNYRFAQNSLPISVPYVILKGTSAAQYYSYPEYRTMGDIDIMTRHEDFDEACASLLENGYVENTRENDFGRHRGFFGHGIEVEVHAFFALFSDPEKTEYLDKLIIDNINPSHVLPDPVNGLVLLEHINQHLEDGLGLRQIIDWMMFVDKCLSDDRWPDFRVMAERIGLEKLAVVTTRMCEIYLGLSARDWCKNADVELCGRLMDYVMACGNFGKMRTDSNSTGAGILTYARSPGATLRLLQQQGLVNWKAARRHKLLRPLAWAYQTCRYIKKGLGRDHATAELKTEFAAAKSQRTLFDALGVKQTSKGLAVYQNGKYTRTYKRP